LFPGCEEIQPRPESGFENGENARVSPSARQIVAAYKHMLRLTRTGFRAVVHITVHGRERRSFTVKSELGGFDAHAHGR
jgi:glutamate/tyrosine decarboxylase-like PLP-dependent enzyme